MRYRVERSNYIEIKQLGGLTVARRHGQLIVDAPVGLDAGARRYGSDGTPGCIQSMES
jgi:hypothetical protein